MLKKTFVPVSLAAMLLASCSGSDPILFEGGSEQATPSPITSTENTSEKATPMATPSTGEGPSPSSSADQKETRTSSHELYQPIETGAKEVSFTKHKSCDALLRYLQKEAKEHVGVYGLGTGFPPMQPVPYERSGGLTLESAMADNEAAIPISADGSYSELNVQEEGVGEFGAAVTNGQVIVSMARSTYQNKSKVIITDPKNLETLASIPTKSFDATVAFVDDNTIVISDTVYSTHPRKTLSRVDISDPKEPKITSTVKMEGSFQSARIIDGNVIVALNTSPYGLAFTEPKNGSLRAEREAIKNNKEIIDKSTIDQWLPNVGYSDSEGNPVGKVIQLVDCDKVLTSGDGQFNSTTIAAFDANKEDMPIRSGSAIFREGNGVYSSKNRMVIYEHDWARGLFASDDGFMRLLSFSIEDLDDIHLVANGAIKGTINNTWNIDEQDGIYRVASIYFGDTTESLVSVLQEQDGKLATVGQLKGLGKDEDIKAMRWLTPTLGTMVTFRFTDPVYTIDTSDPTSPKVRGELKIPGFSSYLHPLGNDELLGIGQTADEKTGQTKGLKASLFDISDLDNPKEVDVLEFTDAISEAEFDHQAFTYHNGASYLVATNYTNGEANLLGFKSEDSKLQKIAREKLTQKNKDKLWGNDSYRTIVIDGVVYVISDQSIESFDANTMKQLGHTVFED